MVQQIGEYTECYAVENQSASGLWQILLAVAS